MTASELAQIIARSKVEAFSKKHLNDVIRGREDLVPDSVRPAFVAASRGVPLPASVTDLMYKNFLYEALQSEQVRQQAEEDRVRSQNLLKRVEELSKPKKPWYMKLFD